MRIVQLLPLLSLFVILSVSSNGYAKTTSLITKTSQLGFNETVVQLTKAIKAKGLAHFATIKHHKGAKKVGLELRPTTLIIFGNPKVGTKLMQDDQGLGLELPLKLLVSQQSDGSVLISYKNPEELTKHFQLKNKGPILKKVKAAIGGIVQAGQ